MLAQPLDRTPARPRLVLGVLLLGALFLVSSSTGRADDAAPSGGAISLVPADASFFVSMLRNREQVELFYKSNAYKTLRALPIVKEAHAKAMQDLEKEDGPISMYKRFTADKENKELADLLLEAVSDEVFFSGGKSWGDFLRLAMQINNAQSWAPLTASLQGGDPSRAQTRAILHALQKNRELLKIPDTFLGFKVKDSKKAENQLKRLEKLAEAAMQNAPPQFKGKLKRQKIGGGDFLTLELDGSLIPWEDTNLAAIEEKKDEFEDLIKAVKKLTLTVSLGVKDGYLLLAFTPNVKSLEQLGTRGKTLTSLPELAPLVKASSKPLTGISYSSAELAAAAAASRADLDSIGANLKEILGKAEGLKEERKKAIAKDIDALVADSKKFVQPRGVQLGFAYMTPTGYESFAYDYTKYERLDGVDCKLRNNLGGNPIFAAAFGCRSTGENYKMFVKWIKTVHGHGEAILLDAAPDEVKDLYKKGSQALMPIIHRFDTITTKDLLPSIRETGLGLVIDAKWTSKQWHNQLPPLEKALPMLELGLLVGVNDGAGFARAMTGYRKTLNELYAKARGLVPEGNAMPEFAIPDPQSEKVSSGTLYFYPLPAEVGLDSQVQPVLGVGKTAAVVAFSKKHAERLMTNKPLTLTSKPLSHKGNIIGLTLLDWPQFIDVALPIVEFGIGSVTIVQGDDVKKAKQEAAALMKQVKVVGEILKCFKGASSVTYAEEGKVITHAEAIIKDLEKSAEPK